MREIFREGDAARLGRLIERAGQDVEKWALMLNAAEDATWLDWVTEQAVEAGMWSQRLDDARSLRLADLAGEPPF